MVDFPNNPIDGQVHTEEGSQWVHRLPPGVWQMVNSGANVEIVEADVSAGWQVWGDVLIQWGLSSFSGTTDRNIIYSQPFKAGTTPYATAVLDAAPATDSAYSMSVSGVTATEFKIHPRFHTNASTIVAASDSVFWTAVGEAPDNLKKAKTVTGAGGLDEREWQVIREYAPNAGLGYLNIFNLDGYDDIQLDFVRLLPTAASGLRAQVSNDNGATWVADVSSYGNSWISNGTWADRALFDRLHIGSYTGIANTFFASTGTYTMRDMSTPGGGPAICDGHVTGLQENGSSVMLTTRGDVNATGPFNAVRLFFENTTFQGTGRVIVRGRKAGI